MLNAKIPAGPLDDKWTDYKGHCKLVNPANKRKLEIIVVGTGLAGASAAASLGEMGYKVKAFCFQDSPRRAHSIAAQGGINAAKNYQNDGDSVFRLFYDTIKGGDYRSREANVHRLAEVSTNIIDQCVAQGVPFAREYGGLLSNRSFGGTQVQRTFYAAGQTGQQLLIGAYPCIKGAAKGWHKAEVIPIAQINVINLDAHADYRPMEGRHSGNAFRYAEEDGYLEKYCVVGLHENYLQQNVWMDMVNNPFVDCITFEDIFIHEKRNFTQALKDATEFTDDTLCGIELDLDCIEHTLSSAATPVGITAVHARQYVNYVVLDTQPAYLHICEGATNLADGRTDAATGKLISYLVSDFVKGMQQVY